MSNQATQSSKHHFGLFEVDLRSGEIFKEGRRVKLQDQPFRLLTLLLQRPDELITREELQRELWSDGTFVEFEHSLNTAVKKLRQALDDDVEHPQYIQTVPRHGYRFIGELIRPSVQSVSEHSGFKGLSKARRGTFMALLGTCVITAVAAGVWVKTSRNRVPAFSERPLSDLTRLTADPGLSWEPSISPDGRLVAYASDRAESNLDIWVQQTTGGEPIRLTTDHADDRQPDFCSDGRVVFRSERNGGGVYSVSALGGSPILLAPGGLQPRCSPDGNLVAYWEGSEGNYEKGSAFIVPSSGGAATRVASDLAQARSPLWSPDGGALLLVGHAKANSMWYESDWWLVSLRGGSSKSIGVPELLAQQLGFRAGAPEPCEWIGLNEVIFSAAQGQKEYATAQTSLWTLPVSLATGTVAGSVRQLTAASGMHKQASVAADGTAVFADLELNPDLWTIRVDHKYPRTEGQLVRLTSDKSWESRPTVSAAGGLMVFRTDRAGGWDFWQKDLHTGGLKPVTISKEAKVVAAISRDGSKTAYATDSAVYVVETKTGSSQRIYRGREKQIADWLPAGDGLLVRNLKTGALELMTLQDGVCFEVVSPAKNLAGSASLSPDGRWISFSAGSLNVAPFRGASLIPQEDWIRVAPDGIDPRWSPDGGTLYFLSARDGPLCLWAVRLHARTRRPLSDPIPVLHLHQRRYALQGSYAVSGDRLFFGIHETTGNIWSGRKATR